MRLLIQNCTVIDAVAETPLEGASVWIEGGRIKAVGRSADIPAPETAEIIDGRDKYVIPGLLNADVHLFCDYRLESLVKFEDRFEEVIVEAAQLALKAGFTTVFDTWGPRRALQSVRDQINRGEIVGSRIYCAGNIIGFDGPISRDFSVKAADLASASLANRINEAWVDNVGHHLLWLSSSDVAREVRRYLSRAIDFVEYAANGHGGAFESSLLAFSLETQRAIVEEAHHAGTTAQAHTTSIEGFRTALEAGCDLFPHANMTGPVPLPEFLLELIVRRNTGVVVFPFTDTRWRQIMSTATPDDRVLWGASDLNVRNLIRAGAQLLLGNDGHVASPEMTAEPAFDRAHLAPGRDNLFDLSTGHLAWFRAMAEKGCRPMSLLRAATCNVAKAYGKGRDLGTVEPGKLADLVILDANPLTSTENFGAVHSVIKEGRVIDIEHLPVAPVLTAPACRFPVAVVSR